MTPTRTHDLIGVNATTVVIKSHKTHHTVDESGLSFFFSESLLHTDRFPGCSRPKLIDPYSEVVIKMKRTLVLFSLFCLLVSIVCESYVVTNFVTLFFKSHFLLRFRSQYAEDQHGHFRVHWPFFTSTPNMWALFETRILCYTSQFWYCYWNMLSVYILLCFLSLNVDVSVAFCRFVFLFLLKYIYLLCYISSFTFCL